jgi:hypothetical protein
MDGTQDRVDSWSWRSIRPPPRHLVIAGAVGAWLGLFVGVLLIAAIRVGDLPAGLSTVLSAGGQVLALLGSALFGAAGAVLYADLLPPIWTAVWLPAPAWARALRGALAAAKSLFLAALLVVIFALALVGMTLYLLSLDPGQG